MILAALVLAAPLAGTPTAPPDVHVVPILAPAPERKAAGYYRTAKGDVYYFDGCNTCSVGDDGRLMGCTALYCGAPSVTGWATVTPTPDSELIPPALRRWATRENLPVNPRVVPIRTLPYYPPGASTLELNDRDREVISGAAPFWGPTPTPTKKPLPYLTPTPRYGSPTPTAASPTPTLPPATPTSAAPTRTPPPTATPGPQTPTPCENGPCPTPGGPTPIPSPPCAGNVLLYLTCPQPGLVEWTGGLATKSDGTPWTILMHTPGVGWTTAHLVTPEMRARQFAEAQRANNEARDLLAGAQSVLREVKRRQEALAPKKKAKKEN